MKGLAGPGLGSGIDPATGAEYARFVLGHRGNKVTDPYFGETQVRFRPRDGDVLVAPGKLIVGKRSCGVTLAVKGQPGQLEVCGVSLQDAERVGRTFDGPVTLGEARSRAGVPAEVLERVVQAAFGRLLFAPLAVSALEERVSFTEIVRYPGSPYEVVREYWENIGDVAERLRVEAVPGDAEGFLSWLRQLHVTLLTGQSGRSFYLPASPVAMKDGLVPGELATEASVTEAIPEGTRFVSGLRVNASPLGGVMYQALLAESVNDPESLLGEREWPGRMGVGPAWGRLVTARGGEDAGAARWFCPPRPIEAGHVEALHAALLDALAVAESVSPETRSDAASLPAIAAALAPPLARLHQGFVRLHPFRAGNQSLVMSLVNHVLHRGLGAGMPHLVLDHLALSLSEVAYTEVLRRALRGWAATVQGQGSVGRARDLSARRDRAYTVLGHLTEAANLTEARELVRKDEESARLVFLSN